MPNFDKSPEQIESDTDRLLLEQAQAFIRDLRATARNAPYGKIIHRADLFAVERGREFTRQALETIIQEQNDLLEKKNETKQCHCGGTREHLGYNSKKTIGAAGSVTTKRVYRQCILCQETISPTDELLGIDKRYTVGLCDLAVYAAADSSFDKSQKRLLKFCGIKLSANTIKMLCDQESAKMKQWQENNPQSWSDFVASEGEIEFTVDGTCVNTLEGWKEIRLGIFSMREAGVFAMPHQWASRHLPKPHVSIAFAAIEEKDVFRLRWGHWQNRLGITDPGVVSALADGAPWIWDAIFLEFSGKAQENLDIFHALEYLSNKGDALFGKGTAEYTWWYGTMKSDLLEGGVAPLLDRVRTMAEMEQLDTRKEVLRVLENYLVFHSGRMNYRERLAAGLSIGSGQVEGACKNLIGARLKQTGAKWRRDRVDRMAIICSIFYGEQWNDYWKSAG